MIISVIRTIVLYTVIIITVRIMGKRQISELQTSELVVMLLMSDIAAIPMQNTDQSLLSVIIPIFILLICEIAISLIMLKNAGFRGLICGRPVIIINDGVIQQKAMKELRMSTEDLFEELRQKDIFDLKDVSYAIVETNGKLSILKKQSSTPVTAKQMGISSNENGMQAVIISDGQFASSSLLFCGLSEKWAEMILNAEGVKLDEVFIMTANRSGQYSIIKKEGKNNE